MLLAVGPNLRSDEAVHDMIDPLGIERRAKHQPSPRFKMLAEVRRLLQHSGAKAVILHHHVWWIEEDHIERTGSTQHGGRTQRVSTNRLGHVAAAQHVDVSHQGRIHLGILLDEDHMRCTAAHRLQAHGADAGKDVQHPAALDVTSENVEHRLLDPIRVRSGCFGLGGFEHPRSIVAGDDPWHRLSIGAAVLHVNAVPAVQPEDTMGRCFTITMYDPYDTLPQALRKRSRLERLGPTDVPTLLIEPEGTPPHSGPPAVLWLHGRTAWKEVDPGRFLRLMRAGVAVIAPDLPGHGQRFDAALQDSRNVLEVIRIMLDELDAVAGAGLARLGADPMRTGIGGMSAGGMVAIARLTRPHTWRCVALEATTGSWAHQRARPMFARRDSASIAAIDPINHLSMWQPIPVLAVHSKADEWVDWAGQSAFLDAVARRGDPNLVERLVFDRTGAEHEHVGFGRFSAEVKERERAFYLEHLAEGRPGLS